jgi:hypothetical protein
MIDPVELAKRLVKELGEADPNTALTALQIARLLVLHRGESLGDFLQECRTNAEAGN